MAAVTIHSDFRAQKKEICHCFHLFPFYLPWNDGTACHDLSFFIFSFKLTFSLSSFTLINGFFSSSLLSAIRVASSAYLRLLFLLSNLIPACNSSSPTFPMCSVHKLNKQGDHKQTCHPPFSILSQPVVPYRVLTVVSWPAYRFLRGQVRWSGIPISESFSQFVMIHTVKGFSVVDETEVDAFLEFPCFLYDPGNAGNLISGSSVFFKPSWTSASSWDT